jgi:C-terminal processing protease CtpA/Prc
MYIDYPNGTLAFRKNYNFNKPFYYDMSGLTVKAPYGKLPIFVISIVRENSPADKAGLKAGDIITNINGKSAANYSLAEIHALFSSKARKQIHISVNRHGKMVSYHFRLEADI